MSTQAREGIYVYQPLGSVTHPEQAKTGRLYGLGGLPDGVTCQGLTKEEAEAFADALNDICWMGRDCVHCGHRMNNYASACSECGKDIAAPWVTPKARKVSR